MSAYFDNPFTVFAMALVAQALAAFTGDFLRKRTHSLRQGERHDFKAVQAASLTLLALIIGFTFSMAVIRYDERKKFEEAEANAIGTEYLRAALLPGDAAPRVRDPLHRRRGRHEVLPTGVLNFYVYFGRKRDSIIPFTFSVTSHIIITAAFALLVFFTVLIYGFYKNGLKFFKIFVPRGIPIYILPLVVFIEIISFLSRPLSHSVRLFANMLAGHITLKVFAGFVALLGTSLGAIGWIGGVVPLAMTVALTALELLVAFLQAYVFAILTCIYLNDAIHCGH